MLQGILFALALSLDGFGVGLSYGMRGIKIPFFPFVIICLSSAIAVSLSMFMGSLATKIIPPDFASTLGGVIMITVGVYISNQNFILNIIPDYKSYKIQLKNMGLVINILKEPAEADMDKSGIIDRKEAIVLGIALAMDAFGAGFAKSGGIIFVAKLPMNIDRLTAIAEDKQIITKGKNGIFIPLIP
jgi:putative sporulation protein YtaF